MPTRPIALFDSGVGGLTVFKAVHELLPRESLVYLGDTARVPYGAKSRDTILRYALRAADYLMAGDVKMLVIACNTATSAALPELRARFAPVPVVGVIEPGAKAAANATRNGTIAVIATEATIRSKVYPRAIRAIMPGAKTLDRACGLFVALAEEGWIDGDVPRRVAERYLSDIFAKPDKPDTLLLGCTHFPLFVSVLRELVGSDVAVVDSAAAAARAVRDELARLNLLSKNPSPVNKFFTTDNPEKFARSAALFLGCALKPENVELVDL